jgi:hypothetical protein
MQRFHIALRAVIVLGLLVPGCGDKSTNGNGPGRIGCERVLRNSGSYALVKTDTLVIDWNQKITTVTRCNGSAFTTRLDTTAAKADSFRYIVKSDSLFLTGVAPSPVQNATGYLLMLRDPGSGAGLNGAWRYDTTMVLASGAIDPGQVALLQAFVAALHRTYRPLFNGVYWSVSSGLIFSYASTFFADNFMTQLTTEGLTDTMQFSIKAERTDDCTVTLRASALGGETVTVYGDASENTNFSSTNGAHTPYIYYNYPPTISACPNATRPPWWSEFVNANRK